MPYTGLKRWEGKVAVVTGASAGMGAAITEAFVKNGIIVAGFARGKEKLDKLAEKLNKPNQKGKLHPVQCDVSQEDQVVKSFKWVLDNVGPVHILVNNAGLLFENTLIDGNAEQWKKTLDVNIFGVCLCTREAIKQMKLHNIDGHIFHMSAILGRKVTDVPNFSVNPAAKSAVNSLAETLRFEINRNKLKIKITTISPGYVETSLKIPGLSGLQPQDIADSILWALNTAPHVQVSDITVRIINEPE